MFYQTPEPNTNPDMVADLAAAKEEVLALLKKLDMQLIASMEGRVFIGPAHPGTNVPTFLSLD